jgi:hypothetical protein
MSLGSVSSRGCPVPWTLSYRARGLQINHNSSDYGLNAWVCSNTIERAAILTTEDSCSADGHIDRESGSGMLARSIIITTFLSAHLCGLAQRRSPPFGAETRSGGCEIRRHLFEMGLVESSSVLLQLHFSVSHDSLFAVYYVDDPTQSIFPCTG